MAELAYYAITGVWFIKTQISDVFVHDVSPSNKYSNPRKLKEAEVIGYINANMPVFTARWGYSNKKWIKGAEVKVEKHPVRQKFLRSVADAAVEDNLDNMLNMEYFG